MNKVLAFFLEGDFGAVFPARLDVYLQRFLHLPGLAGGVHNPPRDLHALCRALEELLQAAAQWVFYGRVFPGPRHAPEPARPHAFKAPRHASAHASHARHPAHACITSTSFALELTILSFV